MFFYNAYRGEGIIVGQDKFKEVCERVIHTELEREGIGTLSEKTVHAVLKYYYESDPSYHEIKVEGKVADIKRGNQIVEIQTRHFHLLRSKLERFLKEYTVTVVYPIASTKYINWVNEETGEIIPKRKSPKKGKPQQVFQELYKIKNYIDNNHFRLIVVLMDIEEYRILNGWSKDRKKGSTCSDRIPIRLVEEIAINNVQDFIKLIPSGLPEEFTTRDFSKNAKVPLNIAQISVNVLNETGIIECIGKSGRLKLYKIRSVF